MPEVVYTSWTKEPCFCRHYHGAVVGPDGKEMVEQVCYASGCECRVYDTEGEP